MPDVFDAAKRSQVMSSIKSKNTKSEIMAFRYLRGQKVYFQKHYSKVKGTPDIALPRKKRAVFIDGDFWHGRTLPALITRRGGPNDIWVKKIEGNIKRDRLQRESLLENGWSILVVWESDIKRVRTRNDVLSSIKSFIEDTSGSSSQLHYLTVWKANK